jgi:hypothetical protein
MLKVDTFKDIHKARQLWLQHWPRNCLFDLWPVRNCFQEQYNHDPYFLVASDCGRFRGMLALSWIDSEHYYGHFPGEVWHGQTWLEQNKIIADDQKTVQILMDHIPAETKIRYLALNDRFNMGKRAALDEFGYLFYPQQYRYTFENYWKSFSGKTRKKIRSEIGRLDARGVVFRCDHPGDIDKMFNLNLARYQDRSYFHDDRFLKAFENLAAWLRDNGFLRVTTILIGGKVAAVDMGAVWNKTYTVLAGGTHPCFPGVAKMINFHHLKWACDQRITMVDFLCGEFNWKHRFQLTPRPLYQVWRTQVIETQNEALARQRQAAYAV